ncbi:MAG TPA: macro domain-containing protein [Candidatus Sulfotelmatobacter sp.]|nr:macro domain-containing protein [Candidatus Sulfotelmatobacter sp.]
MGFLKELLAKQRYPVFLLLFGAASIFFGKYSVSGEITKLTLRPERLSVLQIPLIALGILCVACSVVLFVVDEDFVAYRRGCKIQKTKNGFEAKFRDSKLCVDFGMIQELYDPSDKRSAVVLPANEFFDDRCFTDERTAAGSFTQKYFSSEGVGRLRELVHRQLDGHTTESISVGSGEAKKSYGIGTCVYLGQPLGQPVRMIFAAIASDRPPHGLRAELSTVFRVTEEIKCKLANEHLSTVFMPLFGAGKGGVPTEIAFLTLISALLEARCRDGGHNLKEIHVVVFQPKDRDPDLAARRARRAVRQMVSLYQEMSK